MFELFNLYFSQLWFWKGNVERKNMLDFYREVSECNPGSRNMAAVALDGPVFGQRALFVDGKLKWESKKDGFFSAYGSELWQDIAIKGFDRKGLTEIRGIRVFCDWLGQEMHLVICGGGHVSLPVIKIGMMMGCKVTVLEDRPQFADNARRAGASEVVCESFEQGLDRIPGGDNTYFVIVTRGHRYDQVCLERIVRKKHAYIGMIGSRCRVTAVKEQVMEAGGKKSVLDQLYSPIGLDIGAETPEEIGVAIMAEIIEVKNRKRRICGYSGDMLREILNPENSGRNPEKDRKNPESEERTPDRRVIATIVTRKGSAPRDIGTKMLICPDGRCIGTIGGGCMESEVIRRALHMILDEKEERELCHVDMAGAEAEEKGMVCGGVVDVLLEVI